MAAAITTIRLNMMSSTTVRAEMARWATWTQHEYGINRYGERRR